MRCLCCGKEIKNPTQAELNSSWHHACVKNFFGIDTLPEIDLSDLSLTNIVNENIKNGYTITGVQKKLSLHLSTLPTPRLTIVDYPIGYILKPQTKEYANLPEYEYLTMQMAKSVGINTVPFALIKSIDNEYAYITKRIDRVQKDKNTLVKYAMEDFCQLAERLTQDKYKGSYESCGKIIKDYSDKRNLDLVEMYLRIVFSFVVGNSDMHLKNFSLINTDGQYKLSPAYDMLPVNVILPEDKEQMALTLHAKKSNIKKKEFILFAESIGISERVANNLISSVIKKKDLLLESCKSSLLNDNQIKAFMELINARCSILQS